MNIGILLLRLAVGLTLSAHGSQMLFGWFGGLGLNSTGQFFEERLGFRPGRRHAFLAGLAEAGGGLLLALGLFMPLGAAAAISVMVVAVFSVHIQKGFFVNNGGYEYKSGAGCSRPGPRLHGLRLHLDRRTAQLS